MRSVCKGARVLAHLIRSSRGAITEFTVVVLLLRYGVPMPLGRMRT